VETWY